MHLAPAPPVRCLAGARTTLSYARCALCSAAYLASGLLALVVGGALGGVLGAAAAMLATFIVALATLRSSHVRRYLERGARRRARDRQEAERLARLEAAPMRRQHYIELRDLTERLEHTHPADANRLELQQLLDRFVELASRQQALCDALARAHGDELARATTLDVANHPGRDAIADRRLRHRDAALRHARELDDEIEAIDELIRLYVQRSTCPELDPELHDEVDRRLADLDELDAASRRLGTEPSEVRAPASP